MCDMKTHIMKTHTYTDSNTVNKTTIEHLPKYIPRKENGHSPGCWKDMLSFSIGVLCDFPDVHVASSLRRQSHPSVRCGSVKSIGCLRGYMSFHRECNNQINLVKQSNNSTTVRYLD